MKVIRKLLLLLFLLFLFSSLIKNIVDYRTKLQFYQQYKNRYEIEKKTNIQLKTEILKKSDPAEVEKTIRNDLNLLKPNEVAVILPSPTPEPSIITPTPAPVWKQWVNLYFHL